MIQLKTLASNVAQGKREVEMDNSNLEIPKRKILPSPPPINTAK